ncbi:MAG: ATP-dependent RecD-like DNA helicase [Lachnospiraceae bacterium]|nr:ATP-dependent RecD-like DNA helicase [Lachnospiraceae bacterium]
METIEGYVDHIVYRNQENGYTVMNVISGGEEMTCVGTLPYISEGENIEAEGSFVDHAVYGKQFKIQRIELKTPEDESAIERYLASGAIKGIGAALAARIVRRFKKDTLRVMEEEPERLSEIKGISERKAREIAEQMAEKQDMRKAMIFLQKYGISTALGAKIYQRYGQDLYRVIQENPYRMADDISGIGFKIADEIAARVGIHLDSDYRIKCGITYSIQQAATEGHVYLPKTMLMERAGELLGLLPEQMEKQLMDLAIERKVVIKEKIETVPGEQNESTMRRETIVYGKQFYFMELQIAKKLYDLNISEEISEKEIRAKIKVIERRTETKLDELQKKAVIEAVRSGVFILTGGPGTGKTTTINAMIDYFEMEGLEVRLAAPTGRAAKRMKEATKREAQTIHRLLEVSAIMEESREKGIFGKNEENQLETDVLIIDEMSMVDVYLMKALLQAVAIGTRLILVGDVNQLPSVGPGSILRDLIRSKCLNVVRLNKIFRQATESDIIVNAHKINRGEKVTLDNKSKDFFFLKRDDANVIISVVITLIQKKLPRYVDADPLDIQVLTPMRKGLLGVERLNRILQEYLNPKALSKREKDHKDGLFREGDKVMQIKNNYQIEWEVRGNYGIPIEKGAGVFNGDMGIVREINHFAETMTVEFDERRFVEYPFKQLDELELAYAVTVHKSQGSEYPAVIIPLLTGPRMLMTRNLLYTAVTRARKCVTLVGSVDTFDQMVMNEFEQKRYTTLDERIQEIFQITAQDEKITS